nr:MAG TPA: hypothetical protein [Bacteriophage sp.]
MLVTGPFSNYLNQGTLKEKYNILRKIEWAYKYDIYNSSAIISPYPKQICITNKELRIWLNWVNRNIVLRLGLDYELTIRVKIRIASGMLSKIKSLTQIDKLQIFANLIENINTDFEIMATEDLPF